MQRQFKEKIDIFLNPTSQFGVLDSFTLGLQKALRRAHVGSRSYNMFDRGREHMEKLCEKAPPQCTLGFNVILGPHVLYERLGIPHVAVMVDCASYLPQVFECYNCIAAYVDLDSCRYAQYFGHKPVIWLPHAIDRDMLTPHMRKIALGTKRDMDVVFCGSFVDGDDVWLGWKLLFSKKVIRILEDIVDEVIASSHLHHFDAFRHAYELHPIIQKEMKNKDLSFHHVVSSLDKCIRGRDRARLIKALKSYRLHIFTSPQDIDRWKRVIGSAKKVTFHNAVAFTALPEELQRAKIVVNSSPMMKHGYHERLFLALSQGASVVTNKTDFVEKAFRRVEAVQFYKAPHYDEITKTIDALLESEEKRLEDVVQAQQLIRKEHTWDNRVQTLLTQLPELIVQIPQHTRPHCII